MHKIEQTKLNEVLGSSLVAIPTGYDRYPSKPPYSPGVAFPEYLFSSTTLSNEVNHAYEGVRDALRLLDLDVEYYGQNDWNPFEQIFRPGKVGLVAF